jgi:TRAP-type uncharacterized transport system substrate-binding protein
MMREDLLALVTNKTTWTRRDFVASSVAADLVLAHRESANMTLENQTIGASPVPWHPGALRFFKEKGIAPR